MATVAAFKELTGPVHADPAVRRVSGADGDLYRKALAEGGGYAAGAQHAFLHATPLGVPLYESMGFHTAQTWAVFLPA